jgi:hypothetical protein
MAQRRESPASSSASAEVEAPEWSTPVSGSGSNAEVVALISGAAVDGPEADQLLSSNGPPESEDPAWAREEEGPEEAPEADAWGGRRFAEDKAVPPAGPASPGPAPAPPAPPTGPVRLELDLASHGAVELLSWLPGMERPGPNTIAFSAPDMPALSRVLQFIGRYRADML